MDATAVPSTLINVYPLPREWLDDWCKDLRFVDLCRSVASTAASEEIVLEWLTNPHPTRTHVFTDIRNPLGGLSSFAAVMAWSYPNVGIIKLCLTQLTTYISPSTRRDRLNMYNFLRHTPPHKEYNEVLSQVLERFAPPGWDIRDRGMAKRTFKTMCLDSEEVPKGGQTHLAGE